MGSNSCPVNWQTDYPYNKSLHFAIWNKSLHLLTFFQLYDSLIYVFYHITDFLLTLFYLMNILCKFIPWLTEPFPILYVQIIWRWCVIFIYLFFNRFSDVFHYAFI
jgi:hypothetical protein